MIPSRENLNNQQSNNPYMNDFNTQSHSHSFGAVSKPEELEEFLLDGMSSNSQKPLANTFLKNESTNNSVSRQNFPQETYASTYNEGSTGKENQINDIVSKFDEDLEKLMRLASNQPITQEKYFLLIERKSLLKEATEKEQKNRKTMSRLSMQWLPKGNCQNLESNIKSKLKSRQTVGGFGLEKNKNRIESSINEQKKEKAGPFDFMENMRTEKMEIEQESLNENTHQNFAKSFEQQRNQPDKESTGANQSNNPIPFSEPLSFTKRDVEGRLSEVKRQRDRLSMGRDNLINFIRNMDEEEKKKEIKIEKHKQRVTFDFLNIIKFISEGDSNEESESKPLTEEAQPNNLTSSIAAQESSISSVPKQEKPPARRMTEFMKPLEPEKVILEVEGEDDFTPLKSYEQEKKKLVEQFANTYDPSLIFAKSGIKIEKRQESEKKKTIDYEKYVFDEYLGKVREKLLNQRKLVEDLKKERQRIIVENAKSLTQFNITHKTLQQMNIEKQEINKKLFHLKERLNPSDYLEYRKIINEFEIKFGIRIHRYDRINKSLHSEGYYVEFTMDNMICRIKRGSAEEPFAIKFQACLGLKNEDLYLTSFGYQWRTLIYSSLINKKLIRTTHFLSFMVNFSAYVQELNQLELTYDFISNMYDLRNPSINEVNLSLEFELAISGKYGFFFRIDLLKLTENDGIEIINIGENERITIPESVLKWKKGTNKLLNGINFIFEYLHECMCKSTEKEIGVISKIAN